MDKYIKLNEVIELIDNHSKQINKDYEEGKISMTSHIAMIGALNVLKEDIIK